MLQVLLNYVAFLIPKRSSRWFSDTSVYEFYLFSVLISMLDVKKITNSCYILYKLCRRGLITRNVQKAIDIFHQRFEVRMLKLLVKKIELKTF